MSLSRILDERAIFPVFQPIVELATRRIVGVEALARGPAGSALEFPDAMFPAAVEAGVLAELDQLCMVRALEVAQAAGQAVPPLLFLNAEPAALRSPSTAELRAAVAQGRHFRVVVEFTERALSAAPAALLRVATDVHGFGDALALDDVGADPLSLAFMPMLEPEVLKLDMLLLRAPHGRETISTAAAVSGFAERTGATVVAEGVETQADLQNALSLGARWGQGWLFGRPGPLSDIAGRPVDRSIRLRPPQRDLHRPTGTPFRLVAARTAVRRGHSPMVESLIDHLLGEAAAAGQHSVVLCAPNGPGDVSNWLPRLVALRTRSAYVGVLSADALPRPVPVHTDLLDAADPLNGETTLVVVGSYMSIALCLRDGGRVGDDQDIDFVLTHDRDLIQRVTRMIMQRFRSR